MHQGSLVTPQTHVNMGADQQIQEPHCEEVPLADDLTLRQVPEGARHHQSLGGMDPRPSQFSLRAAVHSRSRIPVVQPARRQTQAEAVAQHAALHAEADREVGAYGPLTEQERGQHDVHQQVGK